MSESDNPLELKRKSYIELGKIYFWTATINKWQRLLEDDDYKDVIINSLAHLSDKKLIDVFAFVIMPNHIHLIWRINANNGKETTQGSFLKFTAHEFRKMLFTKNGQLSKYFVKASNKQHEFWQRDSLAIHLFTPKVFFQKLDYIHNNPLQGHWSLVKEPVDYKYSSAKFYQEGVKVFGFLNDINDEL
jgi:putative transposase